MAMRTGKSGAHKPWPSLTRLLSLKMGQPLALFVNHLAGVLLLCPYTSVANRDSFLFLFMFLTSVRDNKSQIRAVAGGAP